MSDDTLACVECGALLGTSENYGDTENPLCVLCDEAMREEGE